ncbi:hypothetical protein MXD63_32630 [Frankia sp. Cpl3]|nr:hypothetical protein [Frankia sp. Cpl3]
MLKRTAPEGPAGGPTANENGSVPASQPVARLLDGPANVSLADLVGEGETLERQVQPVRRYRVEGG